MTGGGRPVASAGPGVWSTAGDLVTLLRALTGGGCGDFAGTIRLARQVQCQAGGRPSTNLGLALTRHRSLPVYAHATVADGFSAYLGFVAESQLGVVVLSNTGAPLTGLDDLLGSLAAG